MYTFSTYVYAQFCIQGNIDCFFKNDIERDNLNFTLNRIDIFLSDQVRKKIYYLLEFIFRFFQIFVNQIKLKILTIYNRNKKQQKIW